MPAGKAYNSIATTTLSSAVTSYTFSSIPSTYTDLVLVLNNYWTSGGTTVRLQFNGDTTSNYSWTLVQGNGSTTGSVTGSNDTKLDIFGWNSNPTANDGGTSAIAKIMSYSNTNLNKIVLSRDNYANGQLAAQVGLWRSTSAINSVTVTTTGAQTIGNNTSITLYGIQAA